MSAEKEAKSHDLRDKIFLALLAAAITAIGFLAKDHFEHKNKRDEYTRELHKKLYDKGAEELEKLNAAYADLYELYSSEYAISTYEQDVHFKKFQDALTPYSKYLKEIERYGNSAEVQVAKNLREWWYGIYSNFHLQHSMAERIQRHAKQLLLIENPTSDYFKAMNTSLEKELDEFMNTENSFFYEIGWYQRPVVNVMELYLYYQFRAAIGINITADMAKSVNELPELAKRKDKTTYKDSKTPFTFAGQRSMITPTFTAKGDDDFLERKNALVKHEVKMKFLGLVIENDKELQATLEKREAQKEEDH